MHWLLLCRLLGMLGMLIGGAMAFSLPWAFPVCGQVEVFDRRGCVGMLGAMGVSVALGGALYLVGRRAQGAVLRKEALAVVGLGWVLAGVLGGLPLLFSGSLRAAGTHVTLADALFESVSGFTTTGASVLTELEDAAYVPRPVMFWRSFTHWLGGMGIVVLFVAILGQLGAGGKALMRREVPGPVSEGVRPRVRETALVMWGLYVSLSALLVVVFVLEGMSVFDALCHSFGTMATGGFSTHNQSLGYFQSPLIEWTTIAFMTAAGANFSLYYMTLRRNARPGERGPWARLRVLLSDPEFRCYLIIIAVAATALAANLLYMKTNGYGLLTAVRHAAFTVVSIITTTGFGTEDYTRWSQFAKGLILLLMFLGGCAGSTAGGVKVVRMMVFVKVLRLEIERAFRPNVVRPLKIGGTVIEPQLRHDVVVYISLVLFVFVTSWMLLAAIEPDAPWQRGGHTEAEKLLDCASAVASTLNNVGPGLGVLGPAQNYSAFSAPGKLLLTLLMLLGRLELFAILVLFVPSFWRTH